MRGLVLLTLLVCASNVVLVEAIGIPENAFESTYSLTYWFGILIVVLSVYFVYLVVEEDQRFAKEESKNLYDKKVN